MYYVIGEVIYLDLCKEIMSRVLEKEDVHVVFPNLKLDMEKVVHDVCYDALQKISAVIKDDQLSDSECFMRIEEIVIIMEKLGSNGGNRHDFG